ncbi:MAG: hypothetical protein ACRD35_05810 [Candidatus Acidiferrales bacterium]
MKPSDLISVRFTEYLAQLADLRPVRHQPMTLRELVGLVLTSTGKQPGRVRERLRGGTCDYNIYRYWWDSLEIDPTTLERILAEFPNPDPDRPFRPQACLWARLSDSYKPVPHQLLLEKKEVARRRWFRSQSFWDFLLDFARSQPLAYREYSFYYRADLYHTELALTDRLLLLEAARRLAHRALARQLGRGEEWASLELACQRPQDLVR